MQKEGVPQGSTLSVTLFAVAINPIIAQISPNIKSLLYVDDLMIYYSGSSLKTIERNLQISINNVNKWAKRNSFKFSSSKTTSITFHKRKGKFAASLQLNGSAIPASDEIKYLGLYFDKRLNWKKHFAHIRTTTMNALNLLRCISGYQ